MTQRKPIAQDRCGPGCYPGDHLTVTMTWTWCPHVQRWKVLYQARSRLSADTIVPDMLVGMPEDKSVDDLLESELGMHRHYLVEAEIWAAQHPPEEPFEASAVLAGQEQFLF